MDLDDILRMDRLQCTGDVARAGWILDQEAILDAMDELGIEMQVRIKFMTSTRRAVSERGRGRSWGKGGKGWTHGTHRNKHNHHLITVDQERSLDDSSDTLWHELVHCMQSERWAKETGKSIIAWHSNDYKAVDGEWGDRYRGNTYEIEANQVAEDHADVKLVIYPT